MLTELRIYTIYPERMDAIHERFSNHTLHIFKRLGMKVTNFWVDRNEPKLYYTMEYADMEERNRQWDLFRKDPEWSEVKMRSEANGPIVKKIEEIYMHRADYFQREA